MQPKLSIIVPMYNEQENVTPLYRAIIDAVAKLGYPFEIIFVDDGSADRDGCHRDRVGVPRSSPAYRQVPS